MREAENANSNPAAAIVQEVGVSDAVAEETETPAVSITEPTAEATNSSPPMPLPPQPSDESSSRLLEDIERALSTPPRPSQRP